MTGLLLLAATALAGLLVDAAEARRLADAGATVLDTRDALDFWSGHVPGAVRADWRAATVGGLTSGTLAPADTAAAVYAALGVDDARPVLVVGAWAEGWGEEGRVAWDLVYLGHPAVHVLSGGMEAWDGPTTVWPSTVRPGRFTPRPRPEVRATAADVARGGRPLVDVREPEEYAGARRYGEARGGHVEGAVNHPWRTLLDGSTPLPGGEAPIVYCTGGVRSAMVWVLLRDAGRIGAANYDGSWWEWARRTPE